MATIIPSPLSYRIDEFWVGHYYLSSSKNSWHLTEVWAPTSENKNSAHPGRKFHKALRHLEKLAHGFIFLFSGLFYIWQCHPDEPGEHLPSTESSTADAQAHPDTLHKVYLVLFYCSGLSPSIRQLYLGEPGRLLPTQPALQLHTVNLSVQHNYIFYFQPGTFVWAIQANRVNFTCTASHQRPSSVSSGWIRWSSLHAGQVFPSTTQVVCFNSNPRSGWTLT